MDDLSPAPRRGRDGAFVRNERFDYTQLLPPAPAGAEAAAVEDALRGPTVAFPGMAAAAAARGGSQTPTRMTTTVAKARAQEDLLDRVLAAADADEADRIVRMSVL